MTSSANIVLLTVFAPLFGAVVAGLLCRKISPKLAHIITIIPMLISAICSGLLFSHVIICGVTITAPIMEWVTSGDFSVNWVLRVDALTAIMLIVVTWVSTLVHIYSVGYMGHDAHPQRFMSYLSLFTFFMLMLVTADNFLQMFLGWEGVGLCSYLLIGFWFHKETANAAAMKAFIVNRVGDFGFALGILLVFVIFGSIQFTEVFEASLGKKDMIFNFLGFDFNAINLACLLLFVGAMGKSAQLGLHTWLPDAMEGPTPVSALIHAATMVTAGVFMVARCSPLFELAPIARDVVTYVGAATCIFAATVAMTQHDIKRVIAYSTCSQLGYMFFACGVSAYSAGVFHLATHGFFKALLFLGAGSVIHALSNEQDMRNMGGVWKKIPITYVVMIIGTLAITGIPPFAGHYSKDAILEAAYAAGEHGQNAGFTAYWLGVIAATLTSFYSWRLIYLTFHGKCRASHEVQHHIHESPFVMYLPLLLLAVGAIGSGWYFAEELGIVLPELKFWGGTIVMLGEHNVLEASHHVPSWVKLLPLGVAIAGFAMAYLAYIAVPSIPAKIISVLPRLYNFLFRKWYFDELYEKVFVRPAKCLGNVLWQVGDVKIVDGVPNNLSGLSSSIGAKFSRIQTGYVYHYVFAVIAGVILLISLFLLNFFWGIKIPMLNLGSYHGLGVFSV
jgi:NADH-quinone oxidoreductase subunit L